MLKVFWDKDNIAFISNQVTTSNHSHCLLQIFLSFDEPLQLIVENEKITGKCIIVNKNAKHAFSCDNRTRLSLLVEPTSLFAKELISKINGNYLIYDKENIKQLQEAASALVNATEQETFFEFVKNFAEYLGITRKQQILDERIVELLALLQSCDCYDHTIENFAKKISLSSSRLSHLFNEQIGVPLKSYILLHQLKKAFEALLSGKKITEAAMFAGFDSPSHFAATVKKWMGASTSSYLKDSEFLKVFF